MAGLESQTQLRKFREDISQAPTHNGAMIAEAGFRISSYCDIVQEFRSRFSSSAQSQGEPSSSCLQ